MRLAPIAQQGRRSPIRVDGDRLPNGAGSRACSPVKHLENGGRSAKQGFLLKIEEIGGGEKIPSECVPVRFFT
jgi:hypothetical protein